MSVKKTICIFTAAVLISAVSAQASGSAGNTQIELDDSSTIIEETGITPESEAVPDFSLLLPLEPTALPVLTESNISADMLIQSQTPGTEDAAAQDVFLEGAIGAGWPGFFSGDFQVYRNIGDEPFKLEFFHESVMGMGRHAAADGYESQETKLTGEKQFAFGKNMRLDAAAGFETRTDVLQGKNPGFYDISRQNVTGSAAFSWKMTNQLSVTGMLDSVFNTQFRGSSGAASDAHSFNSIMTEAALALNKEQWGLSLDLKYDFGTSQNRFAAGLSASADIGDYASVAASVSSLFAKQASESVLVPFSVTLKTGPAASFTGSVSGGLKSYAVNPVSLQSVTPFLMTGTIPFETTEWFGEAAADVPLFDVGVVNLSADYAMTAYDGNRVLPDYTSLDAATGLMALTDTVVSVLDTSFGVTIPMKVLNISAGWNISWLDNTRYEKTRGSSSAIAAGVSYAEEKGVWSAGADVLWALDYDPEINLTGCFQVTKSVRLELDVQDVLSLVTGKDRLVCNTYVERGGFAALFVKVNF